MQPRGHLHHLELWVVDLDRATTTLGWLLEQLGHTRTDTWPTGTSWSLGDTYVVLESGPDVVAAPHERRRPGLNHVAFHAGTPRDVDTLTASAQEHGWTLMFPDRHPLAGGPEHYAAYLEDADGFEVELVASG
ncbi:VOC family protein [Cellulomonas xiejunii]|uniref:VOC family protein n=1 Tax=Cellulomonas xiejunii TaxID=2968083 RepID=UPI001D0F22CE|nr:VOC family protein [Cellulomonas xiejunii]MCC2314921.1 VOC family protein [Cellulomonas xiejunii]